MKKKKLLILLLAAGVTVNSVFPAMAAETAPAAHTETVFSTEDDEMPEIRKMIETANKKLKELTEDRDVMALLYLCDDYAIKAKPESGADHVAVIRSGQQLCIKEVAFSEGKLWYQVKFFLQEQECTGYVEKEYLAYSDEEFIAWEKENILSMFPSVDFYADGQRDVEQFPASYQKFLTEMKKAHPKWTFVKFDTGLNWGTVVSEEMKEARSLVPTSSPADWKRGDYGGGWSYASEAALKYYLDPRNFLNQNYIFQFEQLTFNKSYHTEGAIQQFLNATFMAGKIPDDSRTYASAFWNVGNDLGVSPFHLASRVYQEQGAGTSPLISGNYPGYEGLYNYYNIGASGSTDEQEISSGLQRAREEGWTTRYLSLEGGARILSQNYILKGQDTLYLQKFDVDGSASGLYWHQYMQNICAPANEGLSIRKLYMNTNSVDNTFVFKIPVYNNMPANPCQIDSTAAEMGYYAPVFDVQYYYSHYEDLRNAYGNDEYRLFRHFVNQGMKEGRQANEEFNVRIYKANYEDLRNAYGENLERYYKHYIIAGQAEGRNAKTLNKPANVTVYEGRDYKDVFNAEYYANKYADIKNAFGNDAARALKHFVLYGMKEGRQANEDFYVRIYRDNYADLRNAYGDDLERYYRHYCVAGKAEGRNGKTAISSPEQPKPEPPTPEKPDAGITVYNGRDYKEVFDAEYYRNKYEDMQRVYGSDAKKLLKHFVEQGMKEGRQANEEFNVRAYRARYADLRDAYGDDLEKYYRHYCVSGKAEGRQGN